MRRPSAITCAITSAITSAITRAITRAITSSLTTGRSPLVSTSSVLRIGILTYNGLYHTRRCMESLLAHTRSPWQLLVRDNGSSDDTVAYLRSLADPRIRVHLSRENLGVGGGRNWLLGELVPEMDDNDLLVLLDNDIEVKVGWESPFITAFRAQPRLGVAGRWAFSMRVRDTGRDILAEHGAEPGPVDTVQGCTFFIRGATARAVGDFDEALGRFWHEDDDYSIRALHAGWDVRRVFTDAIIHHEHGSGTALHPDRVAGSARNQEYLARKWRALGAIRDDGVPRRPLPEDYEPIIDDLARRLGRPVLRTEVNSALVDSAVLLHGDVCDDRLGTLATPVARLLLADRVRHGGPLAEPAAAMLERVASLLRRRRRGMPASAAAAPRAFSTICTPHAWDDPRWDGTCTTHLRDGSGRDFFARTEARWRDGQLLHALITLGALRSTSRVLLVGQPGGALVAALSHLVGEVVIGDRESHDVGAAEQLATRPLGSARIRIVRWLGDGAPLDGGGAYDVVVCPHLSQYVTTNRFPEGLTEVAAVARTGAVVAVGVSVRIAGPSDGRWLEPSMLADDAMLERAKLTRVGPMGCAVANETLLATVPEAARAECRPQLARARGPHCVTLATLIARKR